jgi:hypothetical protein
MNLEDLERLGYIARLDHLPLDDVLARIPATGRHTSTGGSPSVSTFSNNGRRLLRMLARLREGWSDDW